MCNTEVLHREISNEFFFFDRQHAVIHSFNSTGTIVASMVVQHKSIQDIVTVLCDEFDIDLETARQDVIDLLKTMQAKNLLTFNESQ
jgi:hypothetical protein